MTPINKWRRWGPVTLEDKLETVTSAEELDGFRDQMRRDGRLTTDALAAIERRRLEIR